MDQGFSLTEVLVSLLLMAVLSLTLLKQQWQVSQLFNHTHLNTLAFIHMANITEHVHAGHTPISVAAPFHLSPIQQSTLSFNRLSRWTIHLDWSSPKQVMQGGCSLIWQVVGELADV